MLVNWGLRLRARVHAAGVVAAVAVIVGVLFSAGSLPARAADVTATITAGGSPVTVTIANVGDNASLSFSGTAGERVFVSFSGSTVGSAFTYLRNPDGSALTNDLVNMSGSSGVIETVALPTNGTYSIYVDPSGSNTGSVTVTLYDVPPDPAPSLAFAEAGSSMSMSTTTPGQNMRPTFSGAVGDRAFVNFTNLTAGATVVSILQPDGSTLGGFGGQKQISGSGGYLDTQTLTVAGTYTILIDPSGTNSGGVTATLYKVPADPAPSVSFLQAGSSVSMSTTTPGQNMRPTFSGAVGDRVFVNFTNLTAGATVVSILQPDGSTLGGFGGQKQISGSGGYLDTQTLTVAGTYTIVIDPSAANSGGVTATLYKVPADASDPIAIGGPSYVTTLATPGQNARLPFDGAAGQTIRMAWSNVALNSTLYAILKPDGNPLTQSFTSSSGALNATLPANGTYTALVDPNGTQTGTTTLQLTVTGDAPADGADFAACGTTAVFRAEPVGGSSPQYQFQTATDSGFSAIVDDSGSRPATNTYAPPAGKVGPGQSYYWRWRSGTGAWSTTRSFNATLPLRGASDAWPMWSNGSLVVNEVNGNLFLGLPGPSYPTAVGSMGAAAVYNSLDSANRGLGAGWRLDFGAADAGVPTQLVDHNLLTGGSRFDAVEAVGADGNSTCYVHVGQTSTYLASPGDGTRLAKNGDGTWTFTSGDAIANYRLANGTTAVASLSSVETASGESGKGKLTFTFSTQDVSKVTRVTDDTGRSVSFTWNSLDSANCAAAIVCVTGPDAVSWKYVGDGSGGTSGRLARINDGTRDIAAISYDGSGRVNKLQNANDLDPTHASAGYDSTHALAVSYDGSGRVATVVNGPISTQTPSTSTWSFDYHPGAATATATRVAHSGIAAGTARTANGFTTVTPPRQQGQPSPKSVKVYYDGYGNGIERDDVFGNVALAGYNERDQLIWSEDELGKPTDYAYEAVNDVLTSVTTPDPDGAGALARPVTSYRYDETTIGTASTPGTALQGLQAAYYDNLNLAGRPKLRQTDATVDFNWGSGGPTALAAIDNFSVRWSGNLSVTSAGAYTLSTVSDEGTRLTIDGTVAIDNWSDQTGTTKSSQPISLTAGLHKLALEYYEHTGPAEVHLRWACAACAPAISDQVIPQSALRPAWLNQTSVVTPLGRVAFSHHAAPSTAQPDFTQVKLGDGSDIITSFGYDSYGRPTQKVMPKGNAARTIDSNGELQGTADTDYATTWAYYAANETAAPPAACTAASAVDQAGQLKSKSVHGLATQTFVYDSAGRPLAETRGAGTTCHSYDAEGRLTSETAPGDMQGTAYSYDPAGVLLSATDASGTVSSEYDEAGGVKRSIDSFGAEATFAYDADGNLTSRVAAAGSLATSTTYTTSYSYDDGDRLSSLTDPAGRGYSFFYDTLGRLRATQYPNGTFSWNDFNDGGWNTAVYNRHGTLSAPLPSSVPTDNSALVDYAYGYDLEGRKTQETRTGGGLTTKVTSYGYDALGRLATVDLPDGTARSYSYDRDSNRTAITEDSSTVSSYTYNPAVTAGVDQLSSQTGPTRSFAYDSDGNMTSRGNDTLTWDGWGRLSGGTYGGTTLTYAFDAIGFRRSRTIAGTSTRYLHGGLFETTTGGTITNTDVGGSAGDVAHYNGPPTTASTVSYLYYNGHGDLAAEADTSGTRTANYTYDPFGALTLGSAGLATSERFTGNFDKKFDNATGLLEMGARPYDPSLGRFLSVDPIDGGSLNNYDYAAQDPIDMYDLDGLRASGCSGPSCVEQGGRETGRRSAELARSAVRASVERLKGAAISGSGRLFTVRGGMRAMIKEASELLGSQMHVTLKIVPQKGIKGPAYAYTMSDGTRVTLRPTTKSGSPALEIKNPASSNRDMRRGYKFHFR